MFLALTFLMTFLMLEDDQHATSPNPVPHGSLISYRRCIGDHALLERRANPRRAVLMMHRKTDAFPCAQSARCGS